MWNDIAFEAVCMLKVSWNEKGFVVSLVEKIYVYSISHGTAVWQHI